MNDRRALWSGLVTGLSFPLVLHHFLSMFLASIVLGIGCGLLDCVLHDERRG